MANTPSYMDRTPTDDMASEPQDSDSAAPGQIMLDKSNPDIAEAFANANEGDTFKVVKNDENEVVLEAMPSEEKPEEQEQAPENGGEEGSDISSDKPAIALLIAKKRKS